MQIPIGLKYLTSWPPGFRTPAILNAEDPMGELTLVYGSRKQQGKAERRRQLRIAFPFPIAVRGISPAGERVQFETEMRNLSTGGMYLRTRHDIQDWHHLTVVMRLAMTRDEATPAPTVVARGEILRLEPGSPDGTGFAVALKARRFL
jgi:hypothetical protein